MTNEFTHRGVRYEIIDHGGKLTIRRWQPPSEAKRGHWRLLVWSTPQYAAVERAYRGQP